MRRYLLALEAALSLGAYRLAIQLPVRSLVRSEEAVASHPVVADRLPDDPQARSVRRMIASIERRLPWRSSCIVQALAARSMLRRRRVATLLHFGVTLDQGRIRAHAWLEAGGGCVCGGKAAVGFTPIAAFEKKAVPLSRC